MKTYDVPRLLALLDIDAKRVGREYQAKCPLHSDRNPSWQMQAETGLFHCWSCQAGGGVVSLVSQVLNLDTDSAKAWLRANGVEGDTVSAVPERLTISVGGGFAGKPKFTGLPDGCVKIANRAYDEWKFNWSSNYLEGRGVTKHQILGWMLHVGTYGELANRVIFPIHDKAGILHGFMARTMVGARPRYLTPKPETNPDRTVIFGERWWPEDEADSQVVVTEGAFNALACERAGADYVAALGGSNPGLTVYSKLSKFKRVIIASDPDKAGERVACALKVLQRWTDVTRVELPPGLDAADLSTDALHSRLIAAGLDVG